MVFGNNFTMEDLMELQQDKTLADPTTAQKLVEELIQTRQHISLQNRQMQTLRNDAMTDIETGAVNRRVFEKELARSIAIAKRYNRLHAMMMVSIDNFAPLQAQFGPEVGHIVLQSTAQLLIQNVRPTDIVGRIEGDKFGIIFNEINKGEDAIKRAQELTTTVRLTPCVTATRTVNVEATIGCYVFGATDHSDEVIQRADIDLYSKQPVQ